MSYLELGKELIKEVSAGRTWPSLTFLNERLIEDSLIESIGREVYSNKKIFADYLYYKYEWSDECNDTFNKIWIAEWWYDDRGDEYIRETFADLIDLILDKINWECDEDKGFYIPKGYYISEEAFKLMGIC